MRYVIDIDGTICTQETDYKDAKPYINIIKNFNTLFESGHEVIYFTSRGYVTALDWRPDTEEQFKRWGVKYTELIFGKPHGNIYIDDKAFNINDAIESSVQLASIKIKLAELKEQYTGMKLKLIHTKQEADNYVAEANPLIMEIPKLRENKTKEEIKNAIGMISFMRGISPECQLHNAVNREKERILKELIGE